MIYIEERGKGARRRPAVAGRDYGAAGQRFRGTKDQGPEIGNQGPKTKDYKDQRRFLSVFSLRFVVSRKW